MSTAEVIQFRPREVSRKFVENKKRGFALVYKSLKDAPFYRNPERKSLWLHFILCAAYESCPDTFNGNVIQLQRGQLIGSVQSWADQCGVSYKSARCSMKFFEENGMISVKSKEGKHGYTLITIANFESYQNAKLPENWGEYQGEYQGEYYNQENQRVTPQSSEYQGEYQGDTCKNLNNINKDQDLKIYGPKQADAVSEPANQEITIPSDAAIHEQRGKTMKWGTTKDLQCAEWFVEIRAKAFTAKGLSIPKSPNLASWANDIRLMRSTDKRDYQDIFQLFAWVCRTGRELEFCQSPSKLRDKWDELQLRKANAERGVTSYQKTLSNIAAAQLAAQSMGVSYDDNEPL